MSSLHFIKCYPRSQEDDWNRFLLGPLELVEHASPDFSVIEDHAIFLVNGSCGLAHLPASFLQRIQSLKCKGLYHLGDEFLTGGYELYRHFDFVIRNYYAGALRCDGIKTVVLGYACGMAGDGSEPKASERPLAWCFLGALNAARASMIGEFRRIEPHRLHLIAREGDRKVSRDEYKQALRSSAFVPCPMGNVMLETYRLYEALEAGAIPLLTRHAWMPYHDLVMPGHPIPSFPAWSAARRFAEELLADPTALDALQVHIAAWWESYKATLQHELCDFVVRGLAGEYRASLRNGWRPRTGIRLQTWRMLELMKHHDLTAARGRVGIMLGRLVRRASRVAQRA
jgi:hypothetical protein